jgi:hypothetical protein
MTSADKLINDLITTSTSGKCLAQSPIPRGLAAAAIDVSRIKDRLCDHADFTSYHLMFLLYNYGADVYLGLPKQVIAQILCSSLANVQFVNDWGYLAPSESYDGIAARMLIRLGRECLPRVAELLKDSRAARLFGSEEATMAHTYRYRRADFAYRYAMLILQRRPEFIMELDHRQQATEALWEELRRTGER